MTLETIAEIEQSFYYSGRIKITSETLAKSDFLQYSKLAYANVMRNLWDRFRKAGQDNEYYFYAGALNTKRFKLGESNCKGKRRVDMSDTPVIRLPQNAHIFYVMPVTDGCADCSCDEITQVAPAEAVFYCNPEFDSFPFFTEIGKGLDTYNIPEEVKEVEVQAVYDMDDIDIPNDIAFDVMKLVFADVFQIKSFRVKEVDNNDPNITELRRLQSAQSTPIQP